MSRFNDCSLNQCLHVLAPIILQHRGHKIVGNCVHEYTFSYWHESFTQARTLEEDLNLEIHMIMQIFQSSRSKSILEGERLLLPDAYH